MQKFLGTELEGPHLLSTYLIGKWVWQRDKLLEVGLLGQEPTICHLFTLRRYLCSCILKEVIFPPVQVIQPVCPIVFASCDLLASSFLPVACIMCFPLGVEVESVGAGS